MFTFGYRNVFSDVNQYLIGNTKSIKGFPEHSFAIMNPYEILGVSPHASQAEIKSAYRKLVKQCHPDVNKNHHEDLIKQLNEAYDILSDSARKVAYDSGMRPEFTFEHVEDPRETYRREYIARRKEEGRRKKESYVRAASATYSVLRFIAFPGLFFAILIVVDRYVLPHQEYHEVAEMGWQEMMGKGRGISRSGWSHSRGELFSFMKTKHFIIAVPDHIHVDYDYYATNKQVLTIAVSPILKIPSTVSLVKNGKNYTANIRRTIFSHRFGLQYILLITSFFIVIRKDYSDFNLSIAFFPVFTLLLIWLFFF